MSAALIPSKGAARVLDGRAEPDEVVTPEDASDPSKLARLLIRILRELATMRRRWWPRRIAYVDIDSSVSPIRLAHGFGGRVHWWLGDVDDAFSTLIGRNRAASDGNTLVLTSSGSGIVTIYVEEAG